MVHNNFIVMSSVIIKKEVIIKNQITFQSDFEVLEDTLFFFKIIIKVNFITLKSSYAAGDIEKIAILSKILKSYIMKKYFLKKNIC